MNTQRINLDLAKRTGNQQVTIAQGDAAGTTIVATIFDNGTKLAETGVTAQFLIALPDNRHYVRDDATYEDGVITYVCDESKVASVQGYTDNAYFELHKGDVVASTERFAVIVEPCAYDGKDEGETYDTEIEQALEAMATATGAATEAAGMATTATTAANTATGNANNATTAANNAAEDATLAAAQARGAISANLRFSIDVVQIGGAKRLVIIDAGESE